MGNVSSTIPPLPRRLAPALVATPVPLPAVRLEVGRDAHLVAAGPAGRLEPDGLFEDFADRYVPQRLRARNALGAGVAVVGESVRDGAYLVGQPVLDQVVPGVGLVAAVLLLTGFGQQRRVVDPPDRAGAEAVNGFGPELVAVTASAAMSMVPQRRGQKRRLPVSSRR